MVCPQLLGSFTARLSTEWSCLPCLRSVLGVSRRRTELGHDVHPVPASVPQAGGLLPPAAAAPEAGRGAAHPRRVHRPHAGAEVPDCAALRGVHQLRRRPCGPEADPRRPGDPHPPVRFAPSDGGSVKMHYPPPNCWSASAFFWGHGDLGLPTDTSWRSGRGSWRSDQSC